MKKSAMTVAINHICALSFVLISVELQLAASQWSEVNLLPKSYERYLNELESIMNPKVHPCADFYEFACGNYNEANNVSPYLYNLEDKYQTFVHQRYEFETNAGSKVNDYFDAMENNRANDSMYKSMVEDGDGVRLRAFQNYTNLFLEYQPLLNMVGEWPYSADEWSDAGFNWIHFAADMCSAGIITFFQCVYAKNAILIEPIAMQTRPRWRVQRYMEKFQATVEEAKAASWEVYNFSVKLYNTQFTQSNATNSSDSTLLNNWKMEFIEETLDHFNLSSGKSSHIVGQFVSGQQGDRIAELVERYDKRIIANFLIWKLIDHLQNESHHSFLKYFESIIHYEYLQKMIREKTLEPLLHRFLSLMRRFQKTHQQNMEKKIEKYIERRMKLDLVDEEYKFLQIDWQSYFTNLLNVKKNYNRNIVMGYIVDLEEQPNHPLYYFKLFIDFVALSEQRPIFHHFITSAYDLWMKEHKAEVEENFQSAKSKMEQDNEVERKNRTEKNLNHLLPLFASIDAFKEAKSDYQLWYQSEVFNFMETYFLQFYGLTPDNILYLTYAQLYCGRGNLHKSKVNTMFEAMDEFREEFHCFSHA